jgi:tetratricopeptide (TPR) repeat protein
MKLLLGIVVALPLAGGCRAPFVAASSPYEEGVESPRRTAEAERLTKLAADLIQNQPEEAESLLREALGHDLFFGPAHNNLGVVYLKQDRLYDAAGEFEWARKLMPGHPDPRLNLAITLERAGREEEAGAAYTAALEVYPDYLPAIQGLARNTVEQGHDDKRLDDWLREIAMRSTDPEWREWARGNLAISKTQR